MGAFVIQLAFPHMKKQNYRNHVRYYPLHHFIFYPLGFTFLGISAGWSVFHPEARYYMGLLSAALSLILLLSFMMRQHYALNNQDRIVRLEMRLRYYILTAKSFEAVEKQLTFKQIAALRFASDQELISLIKETIEDDLSPEMIKRKIIDWQPDDMRV
jgi:hypothetical protein